MYKINNKIVQNLDNIPCAKCNSRADWFIRYEFITIYCNICKHMEEPQKLEKHIPNPNAPWRRSA